MTAMTFNDDVAAICLCLGLFLKWCRFHLFWIICRVFNFFCVGWLHIFTS